MQPSFIQQVEPTEVELSGGKVKLLFSLRAAAEIEDAFQAPYLTIVYEALGMDAQGKTAAPMSLERAGQAHTDPGAGRRAGAFPARADGHAHDGLYRSGRGNHAGNFHESRPGRQKKVQTSP